MSPQVGMPVDTQVGQPMGVYQQSPLHDFKYATRTLAAAVIPSTTNFFGAAPSADPTLDRYEQGNTLVTSGKQFTVYSIGVQVFGAAAALVTDFADIINFCCVRLVTNQREWGVFPVAQLAGGGGVSALSGQIAVTPAAVPGAQSPLAITNGIPTRQKFRLANPLIVKANQIFYMELLGPVTTPLTLSVAMAVRIELEGQEQRASS